MSGEFTVEARAQWESIPAQIRERLLSNVWCGHCSNVTTITDFKGHVERGDLVLTGKCATCGCEVARVIEGEQEGPSRKMKDQTDSTNQDLALADATVQEIQLELIRRARPGAFAGEKVVASLQTHRDLWEAVMIDRFCFSNPGQLPLSKTCLLLILSHCSPPP
ncbi:MAG: hypothetical protein MAG451_00974 [Anaerolineales bacterium]|nr:hypothetical protein [Anaerolineales bacterium]